MRMNKYLAIERIVKADAASGHKRSWTEKWSRNLSLLLIPVGLISNAVARRFSDNGHDGEHCVFCGGVACDNTGVCLPSLLSGEQLRQRRS